MWLLSDFDKRLTPLLSAYSNQKVVHSFYDKSMASTRRWTIGSYVNLVTNLCMHKFVILIK